MGRNTQTWSHRVAKSLLAIVVAISFAVTWMACADQSPDESADASTCKPAVSHTINGRTYCVASAEEVEDGFGCPDKTTEVDFGDVLVCSPAESPPAEDLAELYQAANLRGGEGDPLGICTEPNPAEEPGCRAHADCPVGKNCRFETDACFPSRCDCSGPDLWTCTSDCQRGGQCRTGDPCADDSDCATREICRNGACLLDESCTTDSDCPQDQSCLDEACRDIGFCQEDGNCAPDQFCHDSEFACYRIECATEADCDPDEACENQLCESI